MNSEFSVMEHPLHSQPVFQHVRGWCSKRVVQNLRQFLGTVSSRHEVFGRGVGPLPWKLLMMEIFPYF